MTRRLFLIIAAGILWAGLSADALAASGKSKHLPCLRFSLAGACLGLSLKPFLKFDSRQGYYLLSTGECDGGHLSLTLTPDPASVKGCGYAVQQTSLPRLRDGGGVDIGDTPQQVRAKIGAPVRDIWTGRAAQEHVLSYTVPAALYGWERNTQGRRVRVIYRYDATYTIHSGRVWEIVYEITDIKGC